MKRPEQLLADMLKTHRLSIAFAESMTCGLIAHTLGTVSGTSDFLKGSMVCYDEEVKRTLFNISPSSLDKHTAESQQVTDLLARRLPSLFRADIYAAVTGLAAPGGSETPAKPVGTVFFSVYYKKKTYRLKKKFNGAPLQVKKKSCDALFRFIIKCIRGVK